MTKWRCHECGNAARFLFRWPKLRRSETALCRAHAHHAPSYFRGFERVAEMLNDGGQSTRGGA